MKRSGWFFISFFFLMFVFVVSCTNKNYHINGTIEGYGNGVVYLSKFYGDKIIPIDSATVTNGEVSFSVSGIHQPCMLRIYDKKNIDKGFELILNNEDIMFKTHNDSLVSAMKITRSDENALFYAFYPLLTTLKELIKLADNLNDEEPTRNRAKLVELNTVSDELEKKIQMLFDALDSNARKLFAYKVIKSMILPNYDSYLKSGGMKYSDEYEFTQKHFFDNIDFSDTLLLRTPLIYSALKEYFQSYVFPKNSENFKRTADILLAKASVQDSMFDFVSSFLVKIFEKSDFVDVYLYIMDTYLCDKLCDDNTGQQSIKKKYEVIKKSLPGNRIEEIIGMDLSGKQISVEQIQSKAILLFFWAPDCSHCMHAVEQLQEMLNKYKTQSVSIVAFAITNKEVEWKAAIKTHSIESWINMTDLQGTSSPVFDKVHIRGTPELYVINQDKKIITRPLNMIDLDEEISKLLKGK